MYLMPLSCALRHGYDGVTDSKDMRLSKLRETARKRRTWEPALLPQRRNQSPRAGLGERVEPKSCQMHKQNKEGGCALASRIVCENGPKIMKFKIPTKGRKETSKSEGNEFPEN